MKSLKIFTIFENCPADRLKVEKNWVYKGTSSRYFQFCVFFLYLKFGLMNFFFFLQALGRIILNITGAVAGNPRFNQIETVTR